MDAEKLGNAEIQANNTNVENTNPLWQKYRQNSQDQEKLIQEKYEAYYLDMINHPKYLSELEEYIAYGYDLSNFSTYFKIKLEYLKFVEIMNMRQTCFKIECLRFRGYNQQELLSLDEIVTKPFFDNGTKNIIGVINNIANSSAKDSIPQSDLEALKETLTRAIDYDSLNIKFNLNSKDEALFLNIRKNLRNQLLSDELTIYEKAYIRKIVNDIQALIKFEFSSVKCIEDHKPILKRSHSNNSDENSCKKIKLVRSSNLSMEIDSEKADVVEIKQEEIEGKECDDTENVNVPEILPMEQ